MKQASVNYKIAMEKQFRDKAFSLISIGVVNKEAQNSATPSSNLLYLSNGKSALRLGEVHNNYATFEENQVKANGEYLFPPMNNTNYQQRIDVGIICQNIGDSVRFSFSKAYDIKGLTIDFSDNYPTDFTVTNGIDTYTYTLDSSEFTCTDSFDDSRYILITPLHFVNGDNKRLRINYMLMGVGLTFDNSDIESLTLSESVDYVSSELPSLNLKCTILDYNRLFNIDDDRSFINYLIDGQELSLSLGQRLENGSVEYIQMPVTYLSDWGSNNSKMSFTATDRFRLLSDNYSGSNKIYTRTLYQEAITVLTAAGLEPDEYFVDTVLQDITVTNPLPSTSFAQCLQYIANAGRCKLRQGQDGKIIIEGNFENIVEPENLIVTANEESGWSNVSNTRFGNDVVYADFTRNFVSADGSMLFLPSNSSEYLDDTTFVSAEISDDTGSFTNNPTITLELPAKYSYYGISLIFNGNHPNEVNVKLYYEDELLDTHDFVITSNDEYLMYNFLGFNKLVFTFTKTYPRNRILVKKIALGELTDYRLSRFDMKEEPVGTIEKQIKDTRVRVFSFNPPAEEGEEPQAVDDDVWEIYDVNSIGQPVKFENQLIGDSTHAQLIAEWLGNYYANNKTYQVKYRGDPRIDASDIIYMDSEKLNNLQVEVESCELTFNGAYSGKLNLRRAINMLNEGE